MPPFRFILPFVVTIAMTPGFAQTVTFTPAPEVSALMAACTPTDASGPAVRDDMLTRGWSVPADDAWSEGVAVLSAAHLWSFLPEMLREEQIAALPRLIEAVDEGTRRETSAFLTREGEWALLMWSGDNLSCLWAGPETQTLNILATQLGGFPPSEGVATAELMQRLEAGGRNWVRRMAVGRTPPTDLPPEVAPQAVTDAARLDRSPDEG